MSVNQRQPQFVGFSSEMISKKMTEQAKDQLMSRNF